MGPGPGLVARVLWLYCMRLASSGVGGVRRVRLALLYVGSCVVYVGSCVGVLWMFWMRLASSGVGGGCIGCRPKASRTLRTPPTPDDASRMQYSQKTRATSPGPDPIVRWPTSGAPLGSQPLSVVAGRGGLLRRGSGQFNVGLLVLGLAREQRCNTPVRTGSRSWTSLTTTARMLSWSFMRLALVLAALADLRFKFLSWRCAR